MTKTTVTKVDTTGLYDSLVLRSSSGAGYVEHDHKLYQVAQDTDGDPMFIELDLEIDLLSRTSLPFSRGKKFSFRKLFGDD